MEARAAELGHTVTLDPGGLGGDERWTCDCGMAILRSGSTVYGTASSNWCPMDEADG
jgi:hypothetical protein